MTDDDLAEMVALGWNLDPSDSEVIELLTSSRPFNAGIPTSYPEEAS